MRNHGSVILHSEKATPTRTEEFGLTLITILFSAPTWAEQYRTQNKPGISPTTENPARRRIRLQLPFQFPSNRFLPKSSSSRGGAREPILSELPNAVKATTLPVKARHTTAVGANVRAQASVVAGPL